MSEVPASLLEALELRLGLLGGRNHQTGQVLEMCNAIRLVTAWFAAHDMVEVVRCRDCAYALVMGEVTHYYECSFSMEFASGHTVNHEYYCAEGKRRDRP